MDALTVLHEVEDYLGYDLDDQAGDAIVDYANDDPISTDPEYLCQLFDLHPDVYRTGGV